ncbi:MAG: response regulator [Bacteroidales bacterium]|nr:response regulator [Bacteroidales bacterium]
MTNISHEIRLPMNSIVGFAELINIGNISAESRKEYIRIIKQQSNQLLKFIDDISEFAKFESGAIKINKTPCNLNLLLNELLIYFNQQKKLQKKEHIELNVSIPDKKGIVIYTDTGRLHQLFSNILDNAIKFTEKGHVNFGYSEKDGKIEFFVKDTGIGLTKEEQKFVFDRFKTHEETITRKYEGGGLGLTIARGIAKLLGGKIWIDSEPGKGSAFYFNIPFEPAPDEKANLIEEEQVVNVYNWKGKIMLVVEDDEVNYKFIETVLSENQAKVLRAENGLQAIELCKTINRLDIILMDIKMPKMDGFEATRQIRKINKSIPIIAQTAYATEEDRDNCLAVGCNDQVAKPINIEELLLKINRLLMS